MQNSSPDPDFGPQYPKDDPFTARMRFHQSWYRVRVLKVPYGNGPRPSNKTPYGNMLTPADGERGLNFLPEASRHIYTIVNRQIAKKKGLIEPFRLKCNLLSSQPMCFNLFALLVDHLDQATRLAQALLPGEVEQVTAVDFEYAPERPGEYLNDRTAFDAFIEFKRPGGEMGFLGIETKLSEPFSPQGYPVVKYRPVVEKYGAAWLPGATESMADPKINQLFRDHLLEEALLHHEKSKYAFGRFLLLYHPADPTLPDALAKYRALLQPGEESFMALPLDDLLAKWQGQADEKWIEAFRLRYLDLAASQAG